MSDIVDTACATMDEAIAELTRLRAEVEALKAIIEDLKFSVENANADARECEGERDEARRALATIKDRIDTRLNNYLVEMKPGYDDSITGFNEAWDIVRAALSPPQPETQESKDG